MSRAQLDQRDYWPKRYMTVGLCFCATFICYIDRVNISVAIIPMVAEFGWDQTLRGTVLASFFVGVEATGHVYTRYIDDIAISGPQAHQYVQGAVEVVQRSGFRVKHRKTKVERRHGPQELTGFSLNSGHASVTQKYRSEVRRRISKLPAFTGNALDAEIQSLSGCIAYVRLTNAKAAERLERYLRTKIG